MKLKDIMELAFEFVAESPLNKVAELELDRIYEKPLLAVARAQDPLFKELKRRKVLGKEHLSPLEWLPEARTVISYFLPFSEQLKKANRAEGLPAIEWLYGRIEGEVFNEALRKLIVKEIINNGNRALAPALDQRFAVKGKRSNWSERHIAFIAGLGTFSLSKSLITKNGCAGRYGSVVSDLELEVTARDYDDIYEYCLQCKKCIKRCPVGAIKEEDKDDQICAEYVYQEVKSYFNSRYGCGKCQTSVPCESQKP